MCQGEELPGQVRCRFRALQAHYRRAVIEGRNGADPCRRAEDPLMIAADNRRENKLRSVPPRRCQAGGLQSVLTLEGAPLSHRGHASDGLRASMRASIMCRWNLSATDSVY